MSTRSLPSRFRTPSMTRFRKRRFTWCRNMMKQLWQHGQFNPVRMSFMLCWTVELPRRLLRSTP